MTYAAPASSVSPTGITFPKASHTRYPEGILAVYRKLDDADPADAITLESLLVSGDMATVWRHRHPGPHPREIFHVELTPTGSRLRIH